MTHLWLPGIRMGGLEKKVIPPARVLQNRSPRNASKATIIGQIVTSIGKNQWISTSNINHINEAVAGFVRKRGVHNCRDKCRPRLT